MNNDIRKEFEFALSIKDQEKQLQQLKKIRSKLISIVNLEEKSKQEIKEVAELCRSSLLVVV